MRLISTVLLGLVIAVVGACSQENSTPSSPSTPEVGANPTSTTPGAGALGSAGDALRQGAEDLGTAGSQALESAAVVKDCLGLVTQAKFQEAVPVCLKATEAAPENEKVKQALTHAQQQAAALGGVEGVNEPLQQIPGGLGRE